MKETENFSILNSLKSSITFETPEGRLYANQKDAFEMATEEIFKERFKKNLDAYDLDVADVFSFLTDCSVTLESFLSTYNDEKGLIK